MVKVRDLRNDYKTVTKTCNGKSGDKVPRILSSASAFLDICKGIYKSAFL